MKFCKGNKNFVILIKNLLDSIELNILLNPLYFFFSVTTRFLQMKTSSETCTFRALPVIQHNRKSWNLIGEPDIIRHALSSERRPASEHAGSRHEIAAVSLAPIQPLDLILPLERARIPERDQGQGRTTGRGSWRFAAFTRSEERDLNRTRLRVLI